MYLTHLLAGLADPPVLRVDPAAWTEADWAVQRHLDEQDAAAATPEGEAPRCSGGGGDLPGGGDH